MLNPKKKPKVGRPTNRQLYLDKLEAYDDKILLKMCELAAQGEPSMIRLWHQYRIGQPTKKEDDEESNIDIDLKDLLGTTFKNEETDSDNEDFFDDED